MRVQVGDTVKFRLCINDVCSIQEKKLISTATSMVPTNIGPYHAVYKKDVETIESVAFISQRSPIGSMLLGMSKNETKKVNIDTKMYEIKIENIKRGYGTDRKINVEAAYQKWLKKNCLKCKKKNTCPYYGIAIDKTIMYKKISENTLDRICKLRQI